MVSDLRACGAVVPLMVRVETVRPLHRRIQPCAARPDKVGIEHRLQRQAVGVVLTSCAALGDGIADTNDALRMGETGDAEEKGDRGPTSPHGCSFT